MPVLILAEIGVNHNGSLAMAKELVEAAKLAGADAVKFQTFRAEDLVTPTASKAQYQQNNDARAETQFQMLKKLEFSYEEWAELVEFCNLIGIEFISTPFSLDAVDLLQSVGVKRFKVSSGDLTYHELLRAMARTNLPIILSTGMANMGEIEAAILAIEAEGNTNISILHCVSNYPANIEECNLRVIQTLKSAFGYSIGWSDHTIGDLSSIASVALGAQILEKHITLDQNLEGPDHLASMTVGDFEKFVCKIRDTEKALGTGIKRPTEAEVVTSEVARRSLVVNRDIKKGELIEKDDLDCLRPGHGIPPYEISRVVGLRSPSDLLANSTLTWQIFQQEG